MNTKGSRVAKSATISKLPKKIKKSQHHLCEKSSLNTVNDETPIKASLKGTVLPSFVVVTRFDRDTSRENRAFCEKKGFGCMYTHTTEMPTYIPGNRWVFVVEMNNSDNQILGVGLVRNRFQRLSNLKITDIYATSKTDKSVRKMNMNNNDGTDSNTNTNTNTNTITNTNTNGDGLPDRRKLSFFGGASHHFMYVGKKRLTRAQLVAEDSGLVDMLEMILFKGRSHSKRGVGFSALPGKLLALNKTERYRSADAVALCMRHLFLKLIAVRNNDVM